MLTTCDTESVRPWLTWSVAIGVYLLAVFHRTSLGVAGLEAGERFGAGPAALSAFTMLQVGVYALMQVPTGLLVDRFGPRRMLTCAALLMGAGQVLFAVATVYPLALIARGVLGVGDAMTFVSVIRMVAAIFSARRYPLVVALSATLGAVGNLVATVPLTLLLHEVGWTTTFAVAGVATVGYALVAATRLPGGAFTAPVPVRAAPIGELPAEAPAAATPIETGPGGVRRALAAAWAEPGTRLGFWVHFTATFSPAVLGLLWGYPYLVEAQGMSAAAASSVLALLVVVLMVAGPVIGAVIGHRPAARMPLTVGYLLGALLTWTVLLGWPGGHPPVVVLVLAFGVLAVGGALTTAAFAFVRDANPLHRVGTATGLANVGGFLATTLCAPGIGLLLDLLDGVLAVSTAYRVAFTVPVALLLVGTWRCVVWHRRGGSSVPVAGGTRVDDTVPAAA